MTAGNTIGGTTAANRNVISGNTTDGILFSNAAAQGNSILGNYIGVGADGVTPLGNTNNGINVTAGSNNTIGDIAAGAGNVIANNDAANTAGRGGIRIQNNNAFVGFTIRGNSIYANGNALILGIDLNANGVTANVAGDVDGGANFSQNFPVLTSAGVAGGFTTIAGTLGTRANSTYAIDFYSNPSAGASLEEGQTYLGSGTVTTDAGGNATFAFSVPVSVAVGDRVTATATMLSSTGGFGTEVGSTSEFSANMAATAGAGRIVSGTIYEDVNGNGSIVDVGTQRVAGATVYLYRDSNGNNQLDATDVLVGSGTTDASGNYSFSNLAAARYWVAVDSKTVKPSAGLNTGFTQGDVWAEQTYAAAGAATGPATFTATSGVFFGGKNPNLSDNASALLTSESVIRADATSGDATGKDFGFSFNVVDNVRGDGGDDDLANPRLEQGSLAQFILNANAITGANAMRFVPASAPNVVTGVYNDDANYANDGGDDWWRISVSVALPQITDANTTIDGTAYSRFDGVSAANTNTGSIGTGGPVGTGADGVTGTGDEGVLGQVARPELELRNVAAPLTNIPIGLDVNGANAVIQNLAIVGFGGVDHNVPDGDIAVHDVAGTIIQNNVIGAGAHDFVDPGAALRSPGVGVYVDSGDNGVVQNNLIGFHGYDGVFLKQIANAPTGWQILGNEIRGNGQINSTLDGVSFLGGGTTTVAGNLIAGNLSPGLDVPSATGTILIDNNTISGNATAAGPEQSGIIIRGGTATTTISHNVISGNTGGGILIAGAGNAQITQNSIFGNLGAPGLGIDLRATGATGGDGVTANDPGDGDSGGNGLQNFPAITSASSNGTTVTVSGTLNSLAGTTFTIEFFANSTADPSGNGEGQVYLGSTSVTTNGAGNATFTNVPLTATVAPGWVVSATATNTAAGQTSEFSADHSIDVAPVAVNDAYSVNEDSTLVVGPPTTNLVNWWKFDDGGASQTVVDSGSLGNNGTRGSTAGVDANDPTWTRRICGHERPLVRWLQRLRYHHQHGGQDRQQLHALRLVPDQYDQWSTNASVGRLQRWQRLTATRATSPRPPR